MEASLMTEFYTPREDEPVMRLPVRQDDGKTHIGFFSGLDAFPRDSARNICPGWSTALLMKLLKDTPDEQRCDIHFPAMIM